MMYLANPSTPAVRDAMRDGLLGCMATPDQGNKLQPGWTWAADNGCFSDKWSVKRWLGFLGEMRDVPGCLFAVVPDVVGDAPATYKLFMKWAGVVRSLGYKLAYVTQDGCTSNLVPWYSIDCLFNGGSTEWKLSADALALTEQAQKRGLWTHMGRVNSPERLTIAARHGYDSVDGTYLTFGPDTNLPKLLGFLRRAERLAEHPTLEAS